MPVDNEVTSAQACDLLGGIDRSTLNRWVQRGRIKPTRKLPGLRGAYLFRRSDVEALRDRLAAEEAKA